VNALDFNALASNFGGSGKEWDQGDFDGDGQVTTTDFNFLATNFNRSPAPAPVLGTLVPEPGSLALIGLGAALAVRRRRRC
jgi:hypothetical protein